MKKEILKIKDCVDAARNYVADMKANGDTITKKEANEIKESISDLKQLIEKKLAVSAKKQVTG